MLNSDGNSNNYVKLKKSCAHISLFLICYSITKSGTAYIIVLFACSASVLYVCKVIAHYLCILQFDSECVRSTLMVAFQYFVNFDYGLNVQVHCA